MSRPLSIGLNLVYLTDQSGGAGTYASELVPALLGAEPGTRITAFVGREVPRDLLAAPWASEVRWVNFPVWVSRGVPGNFVLTMGAQWGALPLEAARRRLDVVHGLANIAPIVQPRAATVVTLLDLIWLRFPKTMERRATVGMRLAAIPSARAADRVIAISAAARRDMIDRISLDPDRIDVTHLGVEQGATGPAAPEPELRRDLDLGEGPVVLCVAQKREHKNLPTLVRALAACEDPRPMVVLPGAPTPHEAELRALAAELGVDDRIRFPAWLNREQLEGLYRLASCFVLPSLEEGFGLPVLEAMRRDLPVACSDVSSLPEVTGDAALLFNPLDPLAVRDAVARLLTDRELVARLVERGRERCRAFTWDATARATLNTYRRAIEGRRRHTSRQLEARPRGSRPG